MPLYTFMHILLKVRVQIANEMRLQRKCNGVMKKNWLQNTSDSGSIWENYDRNRLTADGKGLEPRASIT
jgi:hypothetical protein